MNELYVPAGVPVRLEMVSADVLHSLYIPAFRVQRDVVPGMTTTLWFEATEVTSRSPPSPQDRPLPLFCGEYCGASPGASDAPNTQHATMRALVHVLTPQDYFAWTQEGPCRLSQCLDDDPACWGAELHASAGCVACHGVDGVQQAPGPNWAGLWGRERRLDSGKLVVVDAEYVRHSILTPQAEIAEGYGAVNMPPYRFSKWQLDAITAYIRSLQHRVLEAGVGLGGEEARVGEALGAPGVDAGVGFRSRRG